MKSTIGSALRQRTRRIGRAVKFVFASDDAMSPKALKPRRSKSASDFYERKATTKPRFLYRRLAFELANAADVERRREIIDTFKRDVEEHGSRGNFLKFKWCLPSFLADTLLPEERRELEGWLGARREKRNRRYVEAFPDCADEFGVGSDFLNSVFNIPDIDAIAPQTRVFTLGSCFARNIAEFLAARGYNAEAFFQTEDLNSPLSNALMLEMATAGAEQRAAYLEKWIRAVYAPATDHELTSRVASVVRRLDHLSGELRTAAVIIVTIGNVLDFFLDAAPDMEGGSNSINVAPKFLLLSDTEDVVQRNALVSRLKSQGARFRMATLAEARNAIASLYAAIRRINPGALCLLTLSPVPIDSAVGLQQDNGYGSIEIDCVSKSLLRVALHELIGGWMVSDANVRYFPSYEIVRWIGPMLPEPAFGAEDASSRHVSNTILNGVYAYFLSKFSAVAPQLPIGGNVATRAGVPPNANQQSLRSDPAAPAVAADSRSGT
jgi:GSCFA family